MGESEFLSEFGVSRHVRPLGWKLEDGKTINHRGTETQRKTKSFMVFHLCLNWLMVYRSSLED
ncbi:MAG: hypothetical protein LBC91_05555, partial [Candidatus Accumulibacter sp.]|nr:hypothetical protein [Accumulibacter sp.]